MSKKSTRTKERPLFVRLDEKERQVIEFACKIERGKVQGEMSDFTRRILLAHSANIIRRHRQKAGG